jgi:hypothetical protein
MAIAFVQQNKGLNNAGVTTLGVAFTSNTTTGNLIIVAVGAVIGNTNIVTTITDSPGGNTYIQALRFSGEANASNASIEVWYAKNITGGVTPTVTVNFNGTIRPCISIAEYSGLNTIQPFDFAIASPAPAARTKFTVDSPTDTKTPNELICVVAHANDNTSTWTADSNYAHLQSQVASTTGNQAVSDRIVSIQGIQSCITTRTASTGGGSTAMVAFSDQMLPPARYPTVLNSYQSFVVTDGMSITEKVR